ncbi:glycoside hydrolase family 2 protein [Aaosphaeria arxii CBS 175.79]|uniref:Beta-mannosidase A n=1 Tax=Aaosphaeria arxii CBS 175.79 TaxID=1450172 RepID=A0A6A5Y1Q5_9PLEO|nr:glycoside hydrolase family 2 protein [Aaosphaeria arxii CBS 175.79]KAF2018760.1 glycoside hydrolase family 2 protein [Aaosphaeria arxii CBS 175.79]
MARRSWQAVLAASAVPSAMSLGVLDLGSISWTLTSPNYSNISVPAGFPSQAHLDLRAAGIIEDPLYGLNDFNLRWVAEANWTYTSTGIPNLDPSADATWLVFNGLDTFTSVEFCGKHVASTNNQFRQYNFDVSTILATCKEPVLSLNFGSAPNIANAIASLPGQETWPGGVQGLFELPNRHFIRKEQNDFGWDWGPAFAPAGPWQPAYIVQLNDKDLYVRNTLIDVHRVDQWNLIPPNQSNDWVVKVSIDYLGTDVGLSSDTALRFDITDANGIKVVSGPLFNVTVDSTTINGSASVSKDAVELWWPVGLGPQKLYNMTINIIDSQESQLATVIKRVGFRTIVLNELPISREQLSLGIAPGNNWHFEVNGHEFYAKGSNFIPPDPFWPTVTEKRIRQLFESVVDGNQNMLRVWSSGAYSPDFMFDLADEMGILLWSEFEFGDALYPVDKEFLDNVREEVRYQVRRVNHHPSLAFWAGGNELENLELRAVKMAAPEKYERYLAEYETLFLDTIVPVLFGNSRSISYSPSSTTNGWLKLDFSRPQPITERYYNMTKDEIYGDTDHYHYNSADAFNYDTYPVGRFANEFGYHSMPSVQTWQQAVDSTDIFFESETIALRNHHYPVGGPKKDPTNGRKGIQEMAQAIKNWYPIPDKQDQLANFSAWCHTSQIFQADYYRSQIQYYRRGSALEERNLGSLYWQLEDQWQAPTWAGIEYDGRWKALHYVAKEAYQPVIIAPFYWPDDKELEVWVISDLWSTISASVALNWYDWSGTPLYIQLSYPSTVEVNAINGTMVFNGNVSRMLGGHSPSKAILRMDVTAQGTLPNHNEPQTFKHTNWFHPARLRSAYMVDPGLELSHDSGTSQFIIQASKGVAAWVWLDHPAGVTLNFEANAFWLLAGEVKKVGYTIKSDSTQGEWISGVTVRSLWDNTH